MDILIHHQVRTRIGIKAGALVLALLFLSGCSRNSAYTITLGGDIMLVRGGEPILENWEELDLSLPDEFLIGDSSMTHLYAANLESPLTDDLPLWTNLPNTDMNLCAGSDQVKILRSAGFDLLTTNNNHQNDCHDDGILETTQLLEEEGFLTLHEVTGVWMNEMPEEHLVFIGVDTAGKQLDEERILDTIIEQKSGGNFVIISTHWGNEYQAGPDARQEQLAQDWVDAGADIIWGHHPHVLQRMEWLTSSEDGHPALVLYSLGNLLSDQHMLPDTQRSTLVQVSIMNNRILQVRVAPFMMNWDLASLNFELPQVDKQKILDRLQTIKPSPPGVEVNIFSP